MPRFISYELEALNPSVTPPMSSWTGGVIIGTTAVREPQADSAQTASPTGPPSMASATSKGSEIKLIHRSRRS